MSNEQNTANRQVARAGARLQRLGRSLSAMVMPNIGAFIAWGLVTALFIPRGWFPDPGIQRLADLMLLYLLPLLIGYTGGRLTGGSRGGVIGAAATMGLAAGSDIPMFIGAMLLGPLSGSLMRRIDERISGRVAPGFEMLSGNFSAGLLGACFAIGAYKLIGPLVLLLSAALQQGAEQLMRLGFLPLTALIIEPAKVLFLNNALNHGVLGPIGMQEAAAGGKTILFLLETNPGPGIGILLAYWLCGQGAARQSAPGALVIHALGGIHEIYFPYVLLNPLLLLPLIAGSAAGIATFGALDAGLVATPSPGSLLAVLALTPKGAHAAVLAGIGASAAVTFVLASLFIAQQQPDTAAEPARSETLPPETVREQPIREVAVVCDAGLGSSAMGASILRRNLAQQGYAVTVTNCAIDEISPTAQVVIVQHGLYEHARLQAPQAKILRVGDLLVNDAFEQLYAYGNLAAQSAPEAEKVREDDMILLKSNIYLGLESVDRETAIQMAGEFLRDGGYVKEGYIDGMRQREEQLSTYIGKGVAIPHGIGAAKADILRSGMVVLQFPDGVSFGGETAHLVIGIAGIGNEHLNILSNIATVLGEEEDEFVESLWRTADVEMIHRLFTVEREA